MMYLDPAKYKVATFCDFGSSVRKVVLCRHKTIASAGRSYARLWDIYGRAGDNIGRRQWRVWQEPVTASSDQTVTH